LAFGRDAQPYQDSLLFPSNELSVVLRDTSVADGDRAPDAGALDYVFREDSPDLEALGFNRSSRTQVRILSYNVERPGFEQESVRDEFERIFQAVQPDVIHLQEQDDSGLARTLINDWLPLDDENWAMHSMTDKVTLSRLPFVSNWPADRGPLDERILATAIELDGGQRLGLFNVHLTCCDDEVSRQREADSFIAFIREDRLSADPSLGVDMPFVLIGDLNLVATRAPLDTLMKGEIVYSAFGDDFAPDWDGGALGDAVPRHTHQGMTYTWRSDFSSYWPGRLDFVLYTDSVLEVDKAFVVETPSIPQDVLDSLSLGENDTARASDHLPVVVDVFIP
jgi:endonuclease/exonuclease/phosphatase family metal-dependent hydrolase